MSWLAMGGLVCLGFLVLLVVLVVAFVIWTGFDEMATEKRLRENGEPVLAVLVMVNSQFLNDRNIPSAPALSLFTFEPPSAALAEDMREVASELFELYTADDAMILRLPEAHQQMAARVKDDSYRINRRSRVAREMSRGHTLYLADTFLEREAIPDHTAYTRALACLVTGKEDGEIMVLSHEEAAAQKIYQAINAG